MDEPSGAQTNDEPTGLRRRIALLAAGAPALLAIAIALLTQEQGHGWGDDFALYVHQAQSLVKGDVGRLIADTRFMLDNSPTHTFSPPAYPWGFPLLLWPLVAAFGLNWWALKLVGIACLGGLVATVQRLAAPRIGRWPATSVAVVIALCPLYWRWAGSVTSDIPSAFFAFVTLVWIERCRRLGLLDLHRRRDLTVLGLLLAWTFSIRRETLALVIALAAVHLVELVARHRADRAAWRSQALWALVARPYLVAAGAVITLQIALPATLVPDRPSGGGLGQFGENVRWYKSVVAEAFGLKSMGDAPIAAFGNARLGTWLLVVLVALALVGVLMSLVEHGTRDLHLVVFAAATMYGVGTQPFHEFRYLFTLLPLMALFAVMAVHALLNASGTASDTPSDTPSDTASDTASTRPARARAATLLVSLVALLPVVGHLPRVGDALRYHLDYDYVLNGPETPSSQAMFAAVERCTRTDDVISFAQARSMNLYTRRRGIQGSTLDVVLARADWIVVSNDDVNYIEPPIDTDSAADLGLERAWHNDEYSLYRVPHGAPDPFSRCEVEE